MQGEREKYTTIVNFEVATVQVIWPKSFQLSYRGSSILS